VFAIARKALTDLAATSLEDRMCDVFVSRLQTMDGKVKASLANALKSASEPAVIRSAFDLPPAQHAAIQNALNVTFSADVKVRFETAPDVISGIELIAGGQKVAWSIADYLETLEKGIDDLLKDKGRPETSASQQVVVKAEPKPTAAKASPSDQ
jgi:F-type H+-transporting ATPase subunit b